MTKSFFFNYDEKKEKDIPFLMSYYFTNHKNVDDENKVKRLDQHDYFIKYNINPQLSDKEFNKIEGVLANNHLEFAELKPKPFAPYEYFKNPFKSGKKLKMNKLIANSITTIINERKTKKYMDEIEMVRASCIKLGREIAKQDKFNAEN